MNLREWEELLEYGKSICKRLKEDGVDVKIAPYSMYDDRKGLRLIVCDSDGEVFGTFASGVGTFKEMRLGLTLAEIQAKKLAFGKEM